MVSQKELRLGLLELQDAIYEIKKRLKLTDEQVLMMLAEAVENRVRRIVKSVHPARN